MIPALATVMVLAAIGSIVSGILGPDRLTKILEVIVMVSVAAILVALIVEAVS